MLHDGKSIRVAIVGGMRIPFCRAHSVYTGCSNQDMMTATLTGLVDKYDLKGQTLGDVALGAVIKHSKDWNLARESVIGSGLSLKTPGVDLQRACGTSIEACIQIANKIEVCLECKVDFYAKFGKMSLKVVGVDKNFALGRLEARRREILAYLEQEDLLERNAAVPLPQLPLRVGLITSPGSAAERAPSIC